MISKELYWLTLTLGMTALMAFPYVLNRIAVRGLAGVLANPTPSDKPQAEWAQRAQRAHANAVENLVLFAPAALAVHLLQRGDGFTTIACALFLSSRLVHYVVYTLGIPVLRTLAFFGGWTATMMLVARLLGWA